MRTLTYYIATSLDGFIARDDGSFDDFPWDDAFLSDLQATYPETFPTPLRGEGHDRSENRRFDAVLMGRKTYEVGSLQGLTNPYPTLDQYVFSRTMDRSPDPEVVLVSGGAESEVESLKREQGRSIWLCGGGELATTLFAAGLVDEVIIKLNPVVFGTGIPLFSRTLSTRALTLEESRVYPSGHAILAYRVKR